MELQKLDIDDLQGLQDRAEAEGRECLAGAVIVNEQGKAFVQKRSAQRRLFPNCWDIIGGHVDPGETVMDCLRREITEETGWELARILAPIGMADWESDEGVKKREFDFLIAVDGDLEHPQLEWSKNSEFRWIGLDELEILDENRPPADLVSVIVRYGLELAAVR